MSLKLKLIPLAVIQVISGGTLTLMMGSSASAQTVADNDQQPVQKVEITGSNIRRSDKELSSPVQVITADDLKKSGYTTVTQVLQNLTSNGQGSLSSSNPYSWAPGGAGIALHGLSVSATLVLIDGHRMAPYPLFDNNQRAFVDISNIPFDSIERIEVLKDGASAIYGSDAMAGVVNVILKKKFVGTTVSAEAGTATEGGGTTTHFTLSHGIGDLDADGYNAFISLEYRHQDQITDQQRSGDGMWTNYDWAPYGGVNTSRGALTPTSGPPSTLSPYLINPNVPFSGAANSTYFYPGASCSSYAQMASNNGNGCAYLSPTAQIQPTTQNVNVLASFTKRLNDGWQMNVKASLFDSEGDQEAGDLMGYPSSLNQMVAMAPGTTPYLTGNIIPAIRVPASYPGNPFGVPAIVNGVIPDAPPIHTNTTSKAWRLVADFTGSIGEWDIDTSAGFTQVDTNRTLVEGMNVPALNAALNRPVDPFNIMGGNSASDLATIFPSASVLDRSTVEFAELHASRTLMQLPGGDLGFSTGGELLRTAIDSPAPALCADAIIGCNNAFIVGTQSNISTYAEVVAPVLKSLELDGSVRYDHFNTSAGQATTPKVGFKWSPAKQFTLRGTVATGFRAPNAAESGESGNGYQYNNINDPLLCPNGMVNGLPSKGAVVNTVNSCNFGPVYQNVANPNLSPEKSVSETLGVILEPVKGWSSTVDLYQVKIRNEIIDGSGTVADAVRGAPVPTTCADGNGGTVPCTPTVGSILYIPAQFINANSTQTSGIETETRYKWHLGDMGSLNTELTWTHLMSYVLTTGGESYQLAGTHGPEGVSGDTGNPKNRIQAIFTWDRGPLQVATTLNWVSGYNLTDPSTGLNTCAQGTSMGGMGLFPVTPPPSQYCEVSSFLDTDLSASYKVSEHLTIHGSVNNVFNKQPPVDLGTYGGGWLSFNPAFHMAGAIGRFVNVGATYNF